MHFISTLQTRREVLQTMFGATAGAMVAPVLSACSETGGGQSDQVSLDLTKAAPGASAKYPYSLPALPYDFDALASVIDEQMMRIHHGKHHQGYTDKLNAALERHTALQQRPLVELLSDLDSLPAEVRTAVRNNGGGYFNHALFWPMMTQKSSLKPTGALSDAINSTFGNYEEFQQTFRKAATGVFGSGWAWLTVASDGTLEVMQTSNQDTPLMSGKQPVLGIDVWEHAYYLKYQNRRAEYVDNFWNIVNWDQCAANFNAARET